MTSRHVQPGTALAALVWAAAVGTVAWGIGADMVRDVRADLRADRTAVPAAPIVVGEPFMVTVVDCTAVTEVFPCAQVWGLSWVIVWPDRMDRVAPCPGEDGGPVLPCVWTQPAPGGFLVFTDHLEGVGK